ncbi:hypothetical protein MMC25_004140 [Agyrium rufum]|nr:hypothetical protein [Agyrium rufum]
MSLSTPPPSPLDTEFRDWNACHVCSRDWQKPGAKSPESNIERKNVFDEDLLRDFCHQNEISRESLYQAAWAIVSGSFGGVTQPCAAYISPITDLTSTDLIPKIFRCDLQPDLSLKRLLNSIEVRCLEPTSIRSSIEVVARLASRTSLFDTLIVVDDGEAHNMRHPRFEGHQIPLTLRLREYRNTLTCMFVLDALSEAKAYSIASSFVKAVHGLAASHGSTLREIDILGEQDRKRVEAWNSQELICEERCIHHVIRDRAIAAPKNPAICAWDLDITYEQLDILSDLLATHLQEIGTGPENIVPFLFHKSAWTVVAILGILKSGGAPVGLNPEFPLERLLSLIRLTRCRVVLCGDDIAELIQDDLITVVTVGGSSFPAEYPVHLQDTVRPENIGFVVFTSGSTGQPKGVITEHRAYCSSALAQQRAFSINETSRVLNFASHSFDTVFLEILTTLMAGGCICIPSEEQRLNDLSGSINRMDVNWMGITPSMTKLLNPSDVPGLKTMAWWGESSTKDLVNIWADKVELFNAWGPAECSVLATSNNISKASRNPVNIGSHLQACYIWIVSPKNYKRLVPIGGIGEIVVQGPSVGRGYLYDECKTKAVFLPNLPWTHDRASEIGGNAYLTGDLARYNEDGSINFLGRKDTQVKIRGQRVELGEIEYQLSKHSSSDLSTAVEVVRPHHRPDRQVLAAFQWISKAKSPDSSTILPMTKTTRTKLLALKSAISTVLPGFMLPELYIRLTQRPVNPSGKLDRKMLRELVSNLSGMQLAEYSLLPSEETVDVLVPDNPFIDIVGDFFGLSITDISNADTLFTLGGDSISAMRISSIARSKGLSISAADLLRQAGIRQLSKVNQSVKTQPLTPYKPFSGVRHADTRSCLLDVVADQLDMDKSNIEDIALTTDYQRSNIATGLLQSRGGTNYLSLTFTRPVAALMMYESIRAVVVHHSILRTVFLTHDRQLLQVCLKRLPACIECFHNRCDLDVATMKLGQWDKGETRALALPLTKFMLLEREDRVYRIILRISHAQYDGVSLARLLKDLRKAYNGESLLPSPSFAEYVHFTQQHDRRSAIIYWKELLAGAKVTHVLQHNQPSCKNVLDASVKRQIPSKAITTDSATVATVLKAAWALVLFQMSGKSDVVFGATTWGRNAPCPGIEEVFGPCMNHVPVRVSIEAGQTHLNLLHFVQSQYIASLPYENVDFQIIVEEATCWAPWERLSSILLYQNLDEDTDTFEIEDGNLVTVEETRPPADRADIAIYVQPLQEQTFIQINYCDGMIPQTLAEEMLKKFCYNAEMLAQYPQNELQLFQYTKPSPYHIPLTQLDLDQGKRHRAASSEKRSTLGHSKKYQMQVRVRGQIAFGLVARAWQAVFVLSPMEFDAHFEKKTPYYEIWGSHIAAAALAEMYKEAPCGKVTMEAIVEAKTAPMQVNLLSEYMKVIFHRH